MLLAQCKRVLIFRFKQPDQLIRVYLNHNFTGLNVCQSHYNSDIGVFVILEKGHRFGLDLDLFWSGFGFNLESILVSVWILIRSPFTCFCIAFGLVLESDRFQFSFGFSLDWDWRRVAPSLLWLWSLWTDQKLYQYI